MKKKHIYYISIIVILFVVCIGFGYSKLMATLSIDAKINVSSVKWDIACKNIVVSDGSFTNSNVNYAKIDPENPNKISFNVTLNRPGDFYEFTFKLVNSGTLKGKLNSITTSGTTDDDIAETPYIDYKVVGLPSRGSTLSLEGEQLIRIRIEYLPDLGGTTSYNISKSYTFNYVRN